MHRDILVDCVSTNQYLIHECLQAWHAICRSRWQMRSFNSSGSPEKGGGFWVLQTVIFVLVLQSMWGMTLGQVPRGTVAPTASRLHSQLFWQRASVDLLKTWRSYYLKLVTALVGVGVAMAPRVGIAIALDLIKIPSVGTTAAAIATAAGLVRCSPIYCEADLTASLFSESEFAAPGRRYQPTAVRS